MNNEYEEYKIKMTRGINIHNPASNFKIEFVDYNSKSKWERRRNKLVSKVLNRKRILYQILNMLYKLILIPLYSMLILFIVDLIPDINNMLSAMIGVMTAFVIIFGSIVIWYIDFHNTFNIQFKHKNKIYSEFDII